MTRSATRQGLDERKAVDKCANYLRSNRNHLDDATALREGFPIATGVVEGACRFLVRQRLDIAGARWGLAGMPHAMPTACRQTPFRSPG